MKMTGHLLYGTYKEAKGQNSKVKNEKSKNKTKSVGKRSGLSEFLRPDLKETGFKWIPVEPESLKDPFNRFVHLVFTLSNGKHLVLCDSRKFSKVVLLKSDTAYETKHLDKIGPEPLDKNFTWQLLKEKVIARPNAKIKTVLMDPSIVAGIGNIYSDEALWLSSINPERLIKNISDKELQNLFKSIQEVLTKGIDFGGDSMSDYRNILGLPGKFHHEQNVYQKKNEKCSKKGCGGTIQRIVVGGRSTHFCPKHQK